MANRRAVLEDNRNKRDGVIFELHKDSKKTLDHIAARIRTEIIENTSGTSELKSEEIVYFRDKLKEAYYTFDDAKVTRDSLAVSSGALAKIRFNVTDEFVF